MWSYWLLIYRTFRTMWIQSFILTSHMISTFADYESVSRTRTSYKLQKRNPQHWQSRQTDRRSGRCESFCKKGILNCKIWYLSSSVQHPPIFQRSLRRWRWNWGCLLHRGGVHREGQNFIIFCLFVKDVCWPLISTLLQGGASAAPCAAGFGVCCLCQDSPISSIKSTKNDHLNLHYRTW